MPDLLQGDRALHYLVESVTEYSIYMLNAEGRVLTWNRGGERLKGYSRAEIQGERFSRFFTPEDQAAGVPERFLAQAAAEGRAESEGWRVRKDGSRFWALATLHAIRDEAGTLIGFAKITRDITDRRDAELELQRAQDRVAQAQKMEALGQLTGGVAHDFNNLLMVVAGQAQILRRIVGEDAKALRALDAIAAASQRGQDLTRHLLTFARRQRLQPAAFSLAERMEGGLRELLVTSLPSIVGLEIDLPDDLWPVEADPSEFELALLNLAVNARDAMPDGGVLSVTGRNVTLAGEDGGPRGEFVALTLADTGVGIPPDILPRVFEPFFTTKDVSKGTGLGLSQVFGFAEQSGGVVKVESELDKGARITLHLPRAGHAAAAPQEQADPGAAAEAHILLVEDNPDVAEVAAGLLEQLGHRVRTVTSGAAALSALREGDHPDLVFSDIVMAGDLDGLTLARRLRDEAPDIPVLLATGYSQAAETLRDEFPILRKPYTLIELNRAVSNVLAGARRTEHA